MRTFISNFCIVVFIFLYTTKTQSQDPNWSINASDYQYSMTFTTFLNVNGVDLTSSNDKVGAFINGELRGVAKVIYEASVQKYVAYLSIYANTSNEIINFKIYDSSSDSIIDIDKTETFIIDGNIGGIFQSYSIASPALSDDAKLNSFEFLNVTTISSTITEDNIYITLPENSNLSDLSAVFTSSNNSTVYIDNVKQISGITQNNFSNPLIYKIVSESQSILKEYEVSVTTSSSNIPLLVNISSQNNLKTNTIPVLIDISFSKTVSGFESSDILLENAIVSSFTTTDSKLYKVEIIPLSLGDFSLQVPANVSEDENNNQNEISEKIIFNYDILKPIISEISTENDSNSWWFIVTFSKDVLNVDTTDFKLNGVASKDVIISSVDLISNSRYKVSLSNLNNDLGTISLQVKNDNKIIDNNSNLLVYTDYEAYFLTKKTITITADSKTKVYGDEDPELTYSITSGTLENGDELTGVLTRANGENVGEYAISSSLNNDNYDITFLSKNLNITQKPITISSDSKTKIFGDADPDLTYTITSGSQENNDAFSGNLLREDGEAIGVYLIKQGDLSLGNNYEITFIEANFEITASLNSDKFNLIEKINFYPNPTNNILNIDISEQLIITEIKMYNLLGKIVYQKKKGVKSINLNNLNNGVYLIKIITDKGMTLKRIIKN
jgi:hypothetical protein